MTVLFVLLIGVLVIGTAVMLVIVGLTFESVTGRTKGELRALPSEEAEPANEDAA